MYRLFERLTKAFPAEEPEQPPKGVIAFCRYYTRGFERWLVLMAISTAAIAGLEVILFGFLGQLVDWLGSRDPATLLQEEADTLWLMGGLVLIALPLVVVIHSLLFHQTLMANYPMAVRWQAHRYLLGQSYSFYQNEFAGRIATKVMQTAQAVRETVVKLMDVMLYVAVYFFGMVSVVASSDPRLTAPLLIWLCAYIGLLSYQVPKMRRRARDHADAQSVMTGRIVDSYTNFATIKQFSHTQRETEYARSAMDQCLQATYPLMRLVSQLNISIWIINALLMFSISALSIWLWTQGAVTPGAIAVAVGLSLRLNGLSMWIMFEVSSLFQNIGTVQDGINTLSRPRSVQNSEQATDLEISRGEIEFDEVSFHYGKSAGVIERLNLNIQPGEKIGLIGRSGAGKSTIVNLLQRFHDPEQGVIRVDGKDISQVTQESLRAAIGIVSQDTSLLHRSVRENVRYGRPDATEEQIYDAIRKAHADEFIAGLTDRNGKPGLDAEVGERGIRLSGGQRQRIAIARVLLKDAPILLLDEATSALDSEAEAAIQENLYQLMEGKTVIAIAHRLSTIAAMDRLIVLEDGGIAEQGSHDELLRSGGLYAQLWQHQSGGFIGES